METRYGSVVGITPCTCGATPFPHVRVTVDSLMFHPILSRNGVVLTTQREDVELYEEEVDDVRAFMQEVSLPDTHLLDISVPHLEGVEAEEVYDDEEEARANFEVCRTCGNHGVLMDHEGRSLSGPLSKEEAFKDLEKFVSTGHIRLADDNHVRMQILESSLPDHPPQEEDAEDDDDDDDLPF